MTNEIQHSKGDFLTNPQALTGNIVRQYLDPSGKASNEELAYFLATCKERNLNPFTKEVYFIKYGTQPAQVVVSKDAFMKRAEQNPNFDGFEAGIVIERDGNIQHIKGTICPSNATLLGGWAKVYRKDRKVPIEADADFKGYNTGKSMWAKMPALMIRKVALVSAMREAFSENVGGLYTTDEMEQATPIDVTPTPQAPRKRAAKKQPTETIPMPPVNQETEEIMEEETPSKSEAVSTEYPAEEIPAFEDEQEEISLFEGNTTKIKEQD